MSEFTNRNLTPWGYVVDAQTLPDFITVDEFNAFTGNKFQGDPRIAASIPGACASIRNYCSWHISPNLHCGLFINMKDLRDAFVGSDLLIQLPATHVTSIEKIILDAVYNVEDDTYIGEEVDADDYDIGMGEGLLRIYDVGPRCRKSKIFIHYTAGFDDGNIPVIKEIAANNVSHAVANPYGVNSESAGGVSVSYSSAWAGRASASALADDTREVLDSYRARGVY